MNKVDQGGNKARRPRDLADVAVVVGALLSLLAVLGGASFAAWSLSTDNERYANYVNTQGGPLPY